MNRLHLKAGLFYQSFHIVAVVHLAVAVGHGGEIQAGHGQGKRGSRIFLPVPEGFHDAKTAIVVHDFRRPRNDTENFVLAETIKELAHPNHVVMFVGGKRLALVQQVDGIAVDAPDAFFAFRVFAHHFQLLGQVHDGHLHVLVVAHALQGPATCVAAHVEQGLGFGGKHDFKCLLERTVAIKMVKVEPAFLHLGRQFRQGFIQCRPWAEMLQADGAAFFQGFLQMKPAFIIHVMVELRVHVGGVVGDEAPARLAQRVTVGVRVDEHGADAEARFQHHLGGIAADAGLFGHFRFRHAVVAVAQQLENAEFLHQAAHLEHNRSPSNPFGLDLGFSGGQMLFAVGFF